MNTTEKLQLLLSLQEIRVTLALGGDPRALRVVLRPEGDDPREYRVTLNPEGQLRVASSAKLTDDDREILRHHKPALLRLLTKRSQGFRPGWYQPSRGEPGTHPKDAAISKTSAEHQQSDDPGFSPADARMVHAAVDAFDGRVISVGPPSRHGSPCPTASEMLRRKDPDQLALFPPHPTTDTERVAVPRSAENDSPLESMANDSRVGGNQVGILQTQVIPVHPPLKWAGGKRWLVPQLAELWKGHHQRRLVEPFCGGLAATLNLRPKRALLNDINSHVVNFYSWLKRGLIVDNRLEFAKRETLYYQHRQRFNNVISHGGAESSEAAALFYYLNHTCYNGLCRFHSSGEFNVPFGQYRQINYQRDFSEYRQIFAEWEISSGDFEQLAVEPSDFLYADPPYDVEFRSYSKEGFSWDDQIRLAEWAAKHRGPTVVSSQATDRILRLYEKLDFRLCLIDAPRRINCTGDRSPAREVLALRGFD